MIVKLFKPQNEILKQYIECFYLLSHSKNEAKVTYLTFPTQLTVVTAILDAKNIILADKITIKNSGSNNLNSILVCKYEEPFCFQYEGDIKELTILFKPLGLNAFLEKELKHYAPEKYNHFSPFEDYQKTMIQILSIDDEQTLLLHLENYWLTKLKGLAHPFLQQAVDLLTKQEEISISALAKLCQVSHKTLIKHFKIHLIRTPSEFKKVIRFRKTLNKKIGTSDKLSLTELSYIVNYFDQAHMINSFKSLTGLSPKKFFKHIASSNPKTLHWIYK